MTDGRADSVRSVPVVVRAGLVQRDLCMGAMQGLLAAMVADTAPHDLRGTACGVINRVCGVAMPNASVCAGRM